MSHRLTCAVLLALATPLSAFAANLVDTPSLSTIDNNTGWSGTGEAGLAVAKGNSNNETFVGKLNFSYSNDQWKHVFGAAGQYAKDDGDETARRYELYDTSGFRMTDRSYIWGSVRNERDHYSAYEYQWTAAAGYGYEAIRSDRQHLTLEVGPGYRWAKDQDVRVHHDEIIGRGMIDYGLKLTPSTSLVDTLLVESGSDNTFVKNLVGVQVAMSEKLALKAGLETRYNSDVADGIKNTDNLTTVNVVYNFK